MAGKVLLVEDDLAVGHSLRRLLAREGYFVALRESAEGAVALLQDDPEYDLSLLDVGLPGEDGYACCRALRAAGWHAPILMLSGRAGLADRIHGLNSGADDYISKPFEPLDLLARIKAHLRRSREYRLPAGPAREMPIAPDLFLNLHERDAVVRGAPAHLTEREFELLLLMTRRRGEALHKTWLFQQVWGCASDEGIKVLAVYMRRLRRKIEADPDEPVYLQTVRGHGYRLNVLGERSPS